MNIKKSFLKNKIIVMLMTGIILVGFAPSSAYLTTGIQEISKPEESTSLNIESSDIENYINNDNKEGKMRDLALLSLNYGSDAVFPEHDITFQGPRPVLSPGPGTTFVNISPPSQTVGYSDIFTVDVYVEPDEPIMGVALYLSFDQTLIHADSVTEGDLFGGPWSTIFEPGIIDNSSGVISSVYGLIIGAHTVTDSGVFCTITFISQSSSGVSNLDLYNVQVTNETGDYITVTINDGTVQVDGDTPDTTFNPLDDYYYAGPTIDGTATDQSHGDLDKVEMKIQRDSDSYYWTGSTWQSGSIWFDAATGLSGWNNIPWTASNLPSWENGVGYNLEARAYDDIGNIDPTPAVESFTYDTTYPAASIDPIPNYVNYAPDITGGSTDNVDLNHVDVRITDGIYYWDFVVESWTLTETWKQITQDGVVDFWDLTSLDPTISDYTNEQKYMVSAKATDEAGNEESTDVESFWFDNEYPVADVDNIPEYVNYAPDITGGSIDNLELSHVDVQITDGINYWDWVGSWTLTETWLEVLQGSVVDFWDLTSLDPTISDYTNGQQYWVSVKATDAAGNEESTDVESFTFDSIAPEITSVGITFSNPIDTEPAYGWENISCQVTDAVSGVDEVYLNLTYPDTSKATILMDKIGNSYYYNTTYSNIGNYDYLIWAKDIVTNNIESSTDVFDIPPNWDIDMNGVTDLEDLSKTALRYEDTGPNGWIREDFDNDGEVGLSDLSKVSIHYEETWPTAIAIPLQPGPVTVPSLGTTIVSISPSSQNVNTGESFTVDVYVTPGVPIMGVAFYLSYDENLIHADSVTAGDLFDPWSTMFNPGTIDNGSGVISSVYGLIIGAHNVTDPGVFATISFTAQTNTGTSVLDLYNVGVTNETGDYVTDISVNDGSVNNPPNAPSGPSPGDGATGVDINADLSWTCSDPDVGDSLTYDVYFDTGSPPTVLVSSDQSGYEL
jgi:hypothetical protein